MAAPSRSTRNEVSSQPGPLDGGDQTMTDASDGGHPERLTTDVQEAAAALLALASGPPRPSIVPPKPGTGLAKPGITPPVLFTHKTGSLHKRRASVPPNKVRQKRLGTSLFDLSPVRLANRTKRARIEDEEDVPAETTAARVLYNKNNNKRVKPTLQQPTKATRKAPSARPGIKSFNIFEAFLSHTDLLILVVGHLASPDLLNLYAMSAPFHYAMNSNWMTFILASTKRHAPNADKIFPWYCFRRLNMSDPAARISRVLDRSNRTSLLPQDQKAGGVKIKQEEELERAAEELNVRKAVAEVPGFRWLKMVTYREAVVREIKIWFVLDIPVTAVRIALFHHPTYMTNRDLHVLTMFFLKLDMLFTSPFHGTGGEYLLREFLLAERSLTPLWNWLRRADGTCRLDALRLWVRHSYVRPALPANADEEQRKEWEAMRKMPIMGVPPHLVGRWGYECYGLGSKRLMRPDQLTMREAVRRNLRLEGQWIRMMVWGFLDGRLRDMPVVEKENVVLSLIRRRKRKEREEREQREREEMERQMLMESDEEAEEEEEEERDDGEDRLADMAMLLGDDV